jgi:23S rRNA (cytosine1962-C5)-methyltransferase
MREATEGRWLPPSMEAAIPGRTGRAIGPPDGPLPSDPRLPRAWTSAGRSRPGHPLASERMRLASAPGGADTAGRPCGWGGGDRPRGADAVKARVVLRRRRPPRVERGHPWVYRTEIDRVEGAPAPGDDVEVVDADGHRLGFGYYNAASMITVRLLTRDEPPAPDLWERRIALAKARRDRLLPGATAYRAVHAEGDDLPGLVVDRFGDVLVVEALSLGVDVRLPVIVEALRRVFEPTTVYLRSDAPVRRLEGLGDDSRTLAGPPPPERVVIEEEGVTYGVDVRAGQKTGHYFDQRLNRREAGALCEGAEVLDAFCHTGGFGLQALRQGARRVTFVDTSPAALELARENARRNGVADRAEFLEANAFDLLRRLEREGRRFDAVVLDPPAFAKSRQALDAALRGYHEINLRAVRLVRTGGYLVTASCSQPLGRDAFLEMIAGAAGDDRRTLRLVALRGAAPDHPVAVAQPQGDYLKCAFLEVGEGWAGGGRRRGLPPLANGAGPV